MDSIRETLRREGLKLRVFDWHFTYGEQIEICTTCIAGLQKQHLPVYANSLETIRSIHARALR
jgi:hypothetical protein